MVDRATRERWAKEDLLGEVRDGWNHAASTDAMFNILTIPGKEGRWTTEEFFGRGTDEIEAALEYLDERGLKPSGTALDFGCGVGRLTQALGKHFDAHGVDIAEEMIRQAREHHPDLTFHVNTEPNLALFKDGQFDFIYSRIVLQHMPREAQQKYVAEFVRILTDTGKACIQIPHGPDFRHGNAWLSMYGASPEQVDEWVTGAGGKIVDIQNLGVEAEWQSLRYTITR